MRWIIEYQQALQAIAGIAVSFLTLVLIVLTAIYARANWKTMRLMEADIRHRTQPLPRMVLRGDQFAPATINVQLVVIVTTANAPLYLSAVYVELSGDGGQAIYEGNIFQGNRIVAVDETIQFTEWVPPWAPPQGWRVQINYTDLSRLTSFVSVFAPRGQLDTQIFSTNPSMIRNLWDRWQAVVGEMEKT